MTCDISDRLSALSAEALAFVSRDKTETMAPADGLATAKPAAGSFWS